MKQQKENVEYCQLMNKHNGNANGISKQNDGSYQMILLNKKSYNFLFIPPSLQRDRFPKFWVKDKNWSADRLWNLRLLLKFVIVIYRLLWIAQ